MLVRDLEFLASLAIVVQMSTVQAVVFFTLLTPQPRVDSFSVDESKAAAWRRAPRHIRLGVDELTQSPALHFLVLLKWKEVHQV